MKILNSIDGFLNKIETVLLVSLLGTMVLLAFVQVVLRNAFGTGIMWGDTMVRHIVMWAGFMGAALATSDEKHISIDALTRFIPERIRHIVHIFTNLFALVVCHALALAAWAFVMQERDGGGELMLSIPTWTAMLVIPFGYWLLEFHFFVKMADNAASGLMPRKEGHQP